MVSLLMVLTCRAQKATKCLRSCSPMVRTRATSCVNPFSFLVGVYASGARLFACPLDARPPAQEVCTTAVDRDRALRAGRTLAWCSLVALLGCPLRVSAARSLLSTEEFVKPMETPADAAQATGTGPPITFQLGREIAASVLPQPILDHASSPPAWRALAASIAADRLLLNEIADTGPECLLNGWTEVIRPLPLTEIPASLLTNLPAVDALALVDTPLPDILQPYHLPASPLPPRQEVSDQSSFPHMSSCVRYATRLRQANKRVMEWFTRQQADLLHIHNQLASGVSPHSIDRGQRAGDGVARCRRRRWHGAADLQVDVP